MSCSTYFPKRNPGHRPGFPCDRKFLLLLVDDLVVRFDYIVCGLGARFRASCRASRLTCLRLGTGLSLLLVKRLAGFTEHLRQLLLGGADLVHIVAAERLASALDGSIDLRFRVG